MDNSGSFNPFQETNQPQQYGATGGTTTRVYNDPTVKTDIVENYEPFSKPAVIETTQNQDRRVDMEQLERMQRNLEERERNISAAEEKVVTGGPTDSINNFPPFPSFCCFKPCFYQNIDIEIPEQNRSIVKLAFILWISYSLVMFINIIATLAYFVTDTSVQQGGSLFGMALLLFLVFVPLSYIFWFRSIYKAFRTNSSFSFFFFFLVFGIQIIILIIQVLGINYFGSSGWIVALTAKNMGVKIFMLVVAGMFSVVLGVSIYLIIRVNIMFRSSGGSYAKAKEEAAVSAATNSTLRNAAVSAATRS